MVKLIEVFGRCMGPGRPVYLDEPYIWVMTKKATVIFLYYQMTIASTHYMLCPRAK